VVWSADAIQKPIASFGMEVTPQGENFQVKIPKGDLGKLTDDQKHDRLHEVRAALRKAGYPATIQLSHKVKDTDTYRPYPCIWVNRVERVTTRQALARVQETGSGYAAILAKAAAKLGVDLSEEIAEMNRLSGTAPAPTEDGPVAETSKDEESF
jgi:hypothetical protein